MSCIHGADYTQSPNTNVVLDYFDFHKYFQSV